jgi:Ca2+-binding RTX toxin-like protein
MCTYDSQTKTVAVATFRSSPTDAKIGRSGDALAVNGLRCGDATVFNTDRIDVTADHAVRLTLNLLGGTLAPGAEDEPGDTDEIEITVHARSSGVNKLIVQGGAAGDSLRAGQDGINLNADEPEPDADVTRVGIWQTSLLGGDGPDELSAAGAAGTGLATPEGSTLRGGAGADALIGGTGPDLLDGEGSHGDRLAAGPGADTLNPGLGNDDLDGGAGSDTIAWDFDGYSPEHGADIDLETGRIADDATGWTDTVTGVERIEGTRYADTLRGDGSDNVLRGYGGADVIEGGGGADALDGGSHDDRVDGDAGDDQVSGDDGRNVLAGGPGDDHLDSGAGYDRLDFRGSASPVEVNLVSGHATGEGTDRITGGENVLGSAGDDLLVGNGGNNRLAGGAGDDRMSGGGGFDTVDYGPAGSGVAVDLLAGVAPADGDGGSDLLSDVDRIVGSAYADTLLGGDGSDSFAGAGGHDTIDGRAGVDTVDYSEARAGIVVDLSAGEAGDDGDGSSDLLSAPEVVVGSDSADSIGGDDAPNALIGGCGSDVLVGHAGDDRLTGNRATTDYSTGCDVLWPDRFSGGDGDDVVRGSGSGDLVTGDPGNDEIWADIADYSHAPGPVSFANGSQGIQGADGFGGVDALHGVKTTIGTPYDDTLVAPYVYSEAYGGAGADSLTGGSLDQVLDGGPGADLLDGGGGFDIASYSDAPGPVTLDLEAAAATADGYGSADVVLAVEGAYGSIYGDVLRGDGSSNRIYGSWRSTRTRTDWRDSEDLIDGRGGPDLLIGGAAGGTIVGGPGNDNLQGGNAHQTVDYSSAAEGVSVDLLAGTATDGLGGTDTVSYFRGVRGSEHPDRLSAGTWPATLHGGGGADVLVGRDRDDTLDGGPGGDDMTSGAGSDTLAARDGEADDVRCGAGADGVTADAGATDSVADDCERVDRAPAPAPPAPEPSTEDAPDEPPGGTETPPDASPPDDPPPADTTTGEPPPADQPPATEPPAEEAPPSEPPLSEPPAGEPWLTEEPPPADPPAEEPPPADPPADQPPPADAAPPESPSDGQPAADEPVAEPGHSAPDPSPSAEAGETAPAGSSPVTSQSPTREPPAVRALAVRVRRSGSQAGVTVSYYLARPATVRIELKRAGRARTKRARNVSVKSLEQQAGRQRERIRARLTPGRYVVVVGAEGADRRGRTAFAVRPPR